MQRVIDLINQIKINMNGSALNKLECYELIDKAYELLPEYGPDLEKAFSERLRRLKERLDE